jgi:hypothetical protein
VTFDPPYVHAGGRDTSTRPDFTDRYGLNATYENVSTWHDALMAGLVEACRVARCFVIVKCMEFTDSHRIRDTPTHMLEAAAGAGWLLHDRIVHFTGGGIGGAWRTRVVKRTQRAHSYVLVFTPATSKERAGG